MSPYTVDTQTATAGVTSVSDRSTAAGKPAPGKPSPGNDMIDQQALPASQSSHREAVHWRCEVEGSEYAVSDGSAGGQSETLQALTAASPRHMHAKDPRMHQLPSKPAESAVSSRTGGEISRDDWDVDGGRDEAVLAGAPQQVASALAPATDVTQSATDTMTNARAAMRLQRQLDSFSASDLLLRQFEVLGPRYRRRGGAIPSVCGLGCPCICMFMRFVCTGVVLHTGMIWQPRSIPLLDVYGIMHVGLLQP